MVIGTFHNPNWYLSHITPLSRSGVKEVVLVVDDPQIPLERVRFVCPPKWASRLLTRAGAKAIWMIFAGLRYRPDLYMGYHLAPGACSALVAGGLLGRPSCYQMTGGPVEVIGGGYTAVDSPEGTLGRPSRFIESLAIRVVRLFDLVVVRGREAEAFLRNHDVKGSVAIVPGSVNSRTQIAQNDREIHLLFVGRLSSIKQVHQFVEIVHAVGCSMPNTQAAIVGDGPLMPDLQAYAEELGLAKSIEFFGQKEDVRSIMVRSKIFILTSKSEGLSIAMAEAMCAGVVPVVANIGELGDLVASGVNGYLVEPNNSNEYAEKALFLLLDSALWAEQSQRAIEAARKCCDVKVVSEKWRRHIDDVVSKASGHRLQDILN